MTSLLLFLSGFAALVYQVLWMRDLAVLFGNSADAAAVVLAVFFAGLASGAGLFARWAASAPNPLRVYGFLELGIAASALLFLALLDVYGWIYAPLYRRFADSTALLILVKILLAAGVLGIPTTLMGATLPAMVQHRGDSAWLYGMNTAGAAAGAFAAGFYLPPILGFRGSYFLAVALNVLSGAGALMLSRTSVAAPLPPAPAPRRERRPAAPPQLATLPDRMVLALAVASGVLTIALEVVWMRMFAQVLDNSVYGFAAVVVVALVAFALAAIVVGRFLRGGPRIASLALLLAVCGAAAIVQGPAFVALTDGLIPVSNSGWTSYIRSVFTIAALIAGICGFVVGLVFPTLLPLVRPAQPGGLTVGRLLAFNTAGAIAGSLLTTFFVLRWCGVWGTNAAIAVSYVVLALWVESHATRRFNRWLALVALAGVCAGGALLMTLPRLRLDVERGERVLAISEGSHGTVAVTETRDGRLLRLNNSYSLGGTTDRIERERIQTFIPLLLHKDPKQVFFLGLGTGITAGEALRHPVDRIVVCELVPEVVRASREFFRDWTGGLAADPRVDIRVEDGRQYLSASNETFDVIVSDLFVPWHAGTGMLYTVEHFQTVRARLATGGLFAQWLPLFQLSQRDFEVIAATLLSVFPHVAVWRGDFYANRPIVALVASTEPMHLDARRLTQRARALEPGISDTGALAGVLPFYAGNLGEARELARGWPLNTDDRPLIEYMSPRTQWDDENAGFFVSTRLVAFFERLRRAAPFEDDPYLSRLAPGERAYADAGRFYYRAIVHRLRGEDESAQRDLVQALERLPADVQVTGPFMALDPLVQ